MRNILTLSLCIFILSAACISGQATSIQDGSLKAAVDRYGVQAVRALNKNAGESYKVFGTKTFYSDLDHDGDSDAIIELSFCELRRCGQTTQTSNLVVFLKSKGRYRFAADVGFLKFREDNSIEMTGKVESVRSRKIYVTVYGCEVDDEVCLPKYLYRAIYSFKRGGLVMERAYARGG